MNSRNSLYNAPAKKVSSYLKLPIIALCTWWTFRIFFFFSFLVGEGEGGVRGVRGGGVGFVLKIPGGGFLGGGEGFQEGCLELERIASGWG